MKGKEAEWGLARGNLWIKGDEVGGEAKRKHICFENVKMVCDFLYAIFLKIENFLKLTSFINCFPFDMLMLYQCLDFVFHVCT